MCGLTCTGGPTCTAWARSSTSSSRAVPPSCRTRTATRPAEEYVSTIRRGPGRSARRFRADLEEICVRCLRKRPEDRYATAQEVADKLGLFLGGYPIKECSWLTRLGISSAVTESLPRSTCAGAADSRRSPRSVRLDPVEAPARDGHRSRSTRARRTSRKAGSPRA